VTLGGHHNKHKHLKGASGISSLEENSAFRPGRFLGFLGKTFIWLATAFLLFACLFFGRLFYAPINLDFARDTVLSQAESFLPGWQINYGSAEIGWDWAAVRPWVSIEDIELIDRRNRLTAAIPALHVDVSFTGVLSGLSLAQVRAVKAQVLVTDLAGFSDTTDGSVFSDLLLGEGVPRPEIFRPVSEAFSRFTARLLENAPRLESIKFEGFHVELERGEGLSNVSFTAPLFRLARNRDQLSLSAHVDAIIANSPTRLRVSGSADPFAGDLSVSLGFSENSVAHLAEQGGLPEPFTFMHFPVDVDLTLDMAASDGLRAARLDLAVGEGYLYDASAFPERSPVDYGVFTAVYDPIEQILAVDEVDLSVGGNLVLGNGLVYWLEGYDNPGVQLKLTANDVSVEDVQKYWPIKRFPDGRPRGARAWIEQHMLGGIAKDVVFDINLNPDGTSPYFANSFFELRFGFEEIATHFLRSMPPIREATGSAVLNRQHFDITLDSGQLEGMDVSGTKAHMYDIHIRGEGQGQFDLKLDGTVSKVLEILSNSPTHLDQRINMDLNRIAGNAKVSGRLSLPLINGMPRDAVRYSIFADITDGAVSDLLRGDGLSAAALELKVNNDSLSAAGTGNVNGVPLTLYWSEDFEAGREDEKADTSLLVLSGNFDEKDLAALNVDVSNYLKGQSVGEATFLGRNFDFRVGYFSAEASAASLTMPQFGWEKEPGMPANINGTVYFHGPSVRIDHLTLSGETMDATVTVNWPGSDRREFDALFEARKLGNSSFSADIKGHASGDVQVVVEGSYLDISGLLEDKVGDDAQASADADEGKVDLSLKADKLELLNNVVLEKVEGKMLFEGEPKLFALSGSTKFGLTTIRISPSIDETRPITIDSADGGALLRGLGLFAHMDGGAMTLEGMTDGWGPSLSLSGQMEVEDSRLIAKNRLGRKVTEGVISGLDDYLDGGTLDLDVVEFPFTYREGLLDISKVKANGPSMGMTMEGQIEAKAGKINVNGVVVPAYGLNSLLGKIPLVGGLFTGGDGKGLFGVSYRVKGSTEAPNVTVNPLSGLAPGFLRVLFEGRKGKVDDVILPEGPETPITPETPEGENEPATDKPETEEGGTAAPPPQNP